MRTPIGSFTREILSPNTRANLDSLHDMLTFLDSASRKQLAGQPLTVEGYARIRSFGHWLDGMKTRNQWFGQF